jgi:hypothetical protein
MKTSSLILPGRCLCCALASFSLTVIPHAVAQPQKPPVAVAEPVPEVRPAERPGLLFGGHRPVPRTEPEVIEIVPESVARERAKQRKETEGTVPGTLGPDSTLVIIEPPANAPRVEAKKETRPTSNGSQRSTTAGKRAKSSAGRDGRVKEETVVLPATPAPVITEVPTGPAPVREERKTITETREAPRVGGTTTKRASSSSRSEIEHLQKKVKDLEQEVAEARREPQKVVATPPPTTAAGSTPLPIPPEAKDERRPLVVDTPPPSTAVTSKTETVRTGTSDTVVRSEVPAATENTQATTKETQETVVKSDPPPPVPEPAPKPAPTEAPPKVDTSEVAETTPAPTTDEAPAPASQPEAKVTTTAPGKIDKMPSKSDVPVAEKTDKPGFVKSPFPPNKLIDVKGLPQGSLAKDPTTMKVFRVP